MTIDEIHIKLAELEALRVEMQFKHARDTVQEVIEGYEMLIKIKERYLQ